MAKKNLLILIGVMLSMLALSSCDGDSPHEHSYSAWETVENATCTTTGTAERYCDCGEKQSKPLLVVGHDWQSATCETAKKCNNCNITDGSPRGHNIVEEITKQATSHSSGAKFISCTRCNYSTIEAYTLSEYTSEEIYELAEKSVAEVTTYDKSGTPIALGTAFVIDTDGTLVTNYHVIENAYYALITLSNSDYVVSKVLAYSKDIDLAVLKINASTPDTLPIQTMGIKGGATVYAVGSSEGYTLSFSTGVIASPSRTISGVTYIQHEAAISHGNSGGPLLNSYGEVIGINTMTNIDGQNLNFAISCSELDNLDYENALTMSEFYEKECNPFILIKNYIEDYGAYDYENNEYSLIIGESYSSDYSNTYYREATFYADTNEIMLTLIIDTDYFMALFLDQELSGNYTWVYLDSYDCYMTGTVVTKYYNSDSKLSVSDYELTYDSLYTSVRNLASSMLSLLCSYLNDDLAVIGLGAYDIGFTQYNY